MNTKHTPVPWHVERHGNKLLIVHEQLGDPRLRTVVCECYPSSEQEFNAPLLALAPELEEALRRSLNWLASYPGGGANAAYREARAVLAKLDGERGEE